MEALAAASSVLAVVSVAIQLTSSIQKLVSFWDTIQDAPASVLELTSHLRVLGALIGAIEIDLKGKIIHDARGADDAALAKDCLGICLLSVGKLEALTRELDGVLQGRGVKRRWACLKKAFREKKLEGCWAEVERAKCLLLLYQGLRTG